MGLYEYEVRRYSRGLYGDWSMNKHGVRAMTIRKKIRERG